MSECHKKKNEWTKQVDIQIETVALARDCVKDNPPLVKSYSDKLRLLQIEREELRTANSVRFT